MMNRSIGLNEIAPGNTATVVCLHSPEGIRRRFLDIGLIGGTRVRCLGRSPGGDPSAYLIRGAVIAIRAEDAKTVTVTPLGKEAVAWD